VALEVPLPCSVLQKVHTMLLKDRERERERGNGLFISEIQPDVVL